MKCNRAQLKILKYDRKLWEINGVNYNSIAMIFFLLIVIMGEVSEANVQNPQTMVEGIVGGKATLQCKVSRSSQEHNPVLVLWYKDGSRMPFFTLDLRDGGPEQFFDDIMKSRVKSDITGEYLTLRQLMLTDSAHYKCKVSYDNSPSLEATVHLKVYEPPRDLYILDDLHKQNVLQGPKYGPVMQDTGFKIYCVAEGGSPPPSVSWWSGSKLLINQTENLESMRPMYKPAVSYGPSPLVGILDRSNSGPKFISELSFIKIGRRNFNQTVTCVVKNNNISQPLSKKIKLDIYLRPETIKIIPEDVPLRENIPSKLRCEVTGSHPRAKIYWQKARKATPVTLESEQEDLKNGKSISWVTFTPTFEDNKGLLSCYAHNSHLPEKASEDSLVLDVHYIPRVTLSLGKNLKGESIKEGDDVYFECHIAANPRRTQILWHRDGKPVEQDLKAGVLLSEENLVLQRIHRNSAGNYTCSAKNIIGSKVSNTLRLKVMFLPVCITEPETFPIAEEEEVKLLCRVSARPSNNLKFIWLFNNTLDTVEVETTRVVVRGPISYIDYTPLSPRDYGTLSCWATNKVGMQSDPCSFHVIEAGPPGKPQNCVLYNHTVDSLEVQCSPGSDGGSAQRFSAKVYSASTHTLLAELKSKKPKFHVTGLVQGQDYLVTVTAMNNKGLSDPEKIDAIRLKVAEKRMVDLKSPSVSPLVGVFIGLVGGFLLLLIIALLLSRTKISRSNCWRRRRKRRENNSSNNEYSDGSLTLGEVVKETSPDGSTTGGGVSIGCIKQHSSSLSISKILQDTNSDHRQSPDVVKIASSANANSNETSFLLNSIKCPSNMVTRKHTYLHQPPSESFRTPIEELKCNEESSFFGSQSPIHLPSEESFV